MHEARVYLASGERTQGVQKKKYRRGGPHMRFKIQQNAFNFTPR